VRGIDVTVYMEVTTSARKIITPARPSFDCLKPEIIPDLDGGTAAV
jgi:hypothetical protein